MKTESRTLGLSCIENYLLRVFAEELPGYEALFYKSLFPFSDIWTAFLSGGASYARWTLTPRLHETARDWGLLEFQWQPGELEIRRGWHNAVQVQPAFLYQKYGVKPWRPDHYVLLCEGPPGFYTAINDHPFCKSTIAAGEVEAAYDGSVFRFRIIHALTDEGKESIHRAFRSDLRRLSLQTAPPAALTADSLLKFRDAVGILRVLRSRLQLYLEDKPVRGWDAYLDRMDRLYMALEYMRTKKRPDMEKAGSWLAELQLADTAFLQTLKKELT